MKQYRMMALCAVAGLALAGSSAVAQITNAPVGTMAKPDQNFMNEAVEGDLSEIKMGKLAEQKGQSQGVKQFGQMLDHDHGQHLEKAKQTAQRLGLTTPPEPNGKQTAMYDHLSKLSGVQFDRQFAQDMIQDHKETLGKFQKEAKSRGPLADFAEQTIPTAEAFADRSVLGRKQVEQSITRPRSQSIVATSRGRAQGGTDRCPPPSALSL